MLYRAAHPPAAQPGYKVRAAAVAHLHGLDLWNAVVFPMIDPLVRLNGTPALRRALNGPQYAAYALSEVDTDIDGGGLIEVYYNPSGVFAEEAVDLLRQVGAPQHAAVLDQANRILWPAVFIPSDQSARRAVLARRHLDVRQQPRFNGLDAVRDRAERREGSLDSIVERYIRAHPGAFFD